MMKQILAAACAMAMMLTGAAMAETDVRVTALKGPTAMGMAALMNEAESGAVNGNAYDFTIASAVDEVSPKLVRGETDIAAVPANLAAVLYNNTEGQVEVLAVNTLGVLYIVESGDSIGSVEDLRGKTYAQRAVAVMKLFLDNFSEEELTSFTEAGYASTKFDDPKVAPLHPLNDDTYCLELWHGPTSAFKDMALQILPHLLSASLVKNNEKKTVCILVATSGDTGKIGRAHV